MVGQHPDVVRFATISGVVLKAEGIADLTGKTIEFLYIDIDWSSVGRVPGGITISKPGFDRLVIKYSSMKIVSAR